MTSSAAVIGIIVAVAVAGLAAWLAPRRDEPVTPGDVPAGGTLRPGAEGHRAGLESRDARQGSRSPLDL